MPKARTSRYSKVWMPLLVFVLTALVLTAGPAHAAADATPAPVQPPQIKDNDVYLITPELHDSLQRYTRGEIFDLDKELEAQIATSPHVFSLYYFAGLVKVRRMLLDPNDKRDDKRIEWLFKTCMEKAERAEKLEKYRIAGAYYDAMCGAGLAMFHGIRGNYLTTHHYGKGATKQLQRVIKARPKLEGALLFMGIYNYYTGRFGSFTKLLLRLTGMPVGDSKLGVKQIEQAAAQKGPFHYFSNIYAVYAFAPFARYRKAAMAHAEALVDTYPNNYYSYLLRAYVHEKRTHYRKALNDNLKGLALLPADIRQSQDVIYKADIFLMEVRSNYLKVLLDQDAEALKWLHRWTRVKRTSYADAPLLACMYLGHLHSQANLDGEARRWYEKMQSFEGAEWMKDQGKRYEERPMGQRRPLKKALAKKLQAFLKQHPEVKP